MSVTPLTFLQLNPPTASSISSMERTDCSRRMYFFVPLSSAPAFVEASESSSSPFNVALRTLQFGNFGTVIWWPCALGSDGRERERWEAKGGGAMRSVRGKQGKGDTALHTVMDGGLARGKRCMVARACVFVK